MIVRKLNTGKVIRVKLNFTQEQQDEFIEKNPTGGFMKIDKLPTSDKYQFAQFYKMDDNNAIVVDEEAELAHAIKLSNEKIYAQLEELDKKKIRALSDAISGDNSYLYEINKQQDDLRAQLQ